MTPTSQATRILSRLSIAGVLAAGCTAEPAVDNRNASTPPARPNVVLVMADDLGYEALGSYGGAAYATPELDRLAASGVRFTHAYSQPLCSPSRVKIMTGRYNSRNYTYWGILPPGEVTFGHLLRDAGYATFVAGKWQLDGQEPRENLGEGQLPDEAGFDEYLLWFVGGKGKRYADPLLWRTGGESMVVEDGFGPDLFTDFIVSSIENQVAERPDQPFFAYYPMALTHPPYVPTPDSEGWDGDRYAGAVSDGGVIDVGGGDPAYFSDMVAYLDKCVERIIRKLEELGIRDDTLVLFTADNGTPRPITSEMADGTIVVAEKGRPTDGGTHVPFIASWPREIEGGRVSDALIDFSDFLPSLAEAAGATLPEDRVIDGHSFLPLLRGEVEEIRDWIFTDYDSRISPNAKAERFVRDRRFKLYADGRFFEVAKDVLEERPLPEEEITGEAAAARAALQAVLDQMSESG